MWDGQLRRISVVKHRIELVKNDIKVVHSTSYLERPIKKSFSAAETGVLITEKVIEPLTTKYAASIVFVPEKDGSLRFCSYYERRNATIVRD